MDTPQKNPPKAIYSVIDRPNDRPFWLRIGWAFVNRDGSLTLKLDALPIDGRLQVRDWTPREEQAGRDAEEATRPRPTESAGAI